MSLVRVGAGPRHLALNPLVFPKNGTAALRAITGAMLRLLGVRVRYVSAL